MEEIKEKAPKSDYSVPTQPPSTPDINVTFKENDLLKLKNIFERVLVSEILQEVKFSQDVIAKRAGRRKEYIENRAKLILQLLNIPFAAVSVVGTFFPPAKVVTSAVSTAGRTVLKAAEIVTDKVGEHISNKAQIEAQKSNTSFPGFQLQDFVLLKAHLDIFAEQASLRYEPFFMKKISPNPLDGVIPLARVAARRVMDYLGRVRNYYSDASLVNMTFTDLCLEGLILGRSGKKKEGYGFKNNPILVRVPKLSKILKKPVRYSAEGLLSRPAVCSMKVIDDYGAQNPIFYRTKAILKIGDSLLKDKKDRKYDYAVTKLLDEDQPDQGPKYEYMQIDTVTSHRYGFDQNSDGSVQFVGNYSHSTHKPSVYFATLDDLCLYSDYYSERIRNPSEEEKGKEEQKNELMSFIDWIKSKLGSQNSQHICSVWVFPFTRKKQAGAVIENSMSLIAYIADHCDHNPGGIKETHTLSGDFKGVSLKNIDFRSVTLEDVNLDLADCRFSVFTHCRLSHVSMNSTKLACADLRKVELSNCQVHGAEWELAVIEGMVDVTNKETLAQIKSTQTNDQNDFFDELCLSVAKLEKLFGEKIDHIYDLIDSQNLSIDQLESHFQELRQQSYDKYQDYEHFKVYVLSELENTKDMISQLNHTAQEEKNTIEILQAKLLKLTDLYDQINSQQNASAIKFAKLQQSFLQFKASMDLQIVELRAEVKKTDRQLSMEFIGVEGENTFEADEFRPTGAILSATELAQVKEQNKDRDLKFIGARNFKHIGGRMRLFAPVGFQMKSSHPERRHDLALTEEDTNSLDDLGSPEPTRMSNDRENLTEAKRLMDVILACNPDFCVAGNGRDYVERLRRYEQILSNSEFLPDNRSHNLNIIIEELNKVMRRLNEKNL